MEQPKNKPKLWQIFLAIALLVIAWVLPGDGGANLRGVLITKPTTFLP